MVRKVCRDVLQRNPTQKTCPTAQAVDRADYTAPPQQRELHSRDIMIDQEYIFPQISRSCLPRDLSDLILSVRRAQVFTARTDHRYPLDDLRTAVHLSGHRQINPWFVWLASIPGRESYNLHHLLYYSSACFPGWICTAVQMLHNLSQREVRNFHR